MPRSLTASVSTANDTLPLRLPLGQPPSKPCTASGPGPGRGLSDGDDILGIVCGSVLAAMSSSSSSSFTFKSNQLRSRWSRLPPSNAVKEQGCCCFREEQCEVLEYRWVFTEVAAVTTDCWRIRIDGGSAMPESLPESEVK